MEPLAPIPFPAAVDAEEEAALSEVDIAIALVSAGAAVRVRVAGIRPPVADALAGLAAARTSAAHVALSLERSPRATTFTVGPRLRLLGAG